MRMKNSSRKATNVSLDPKVVADAKALGINLSQACENGLLIALKAERERRWLAENKEAIEATNEWVKTHGLPLEEYRLF